MEKAHYPAGPSSKATLLMKEGKKKATSLASDTVLDQSLYVGLMIAKVAAGNSFNRGLYSHCLQDHQHGKGNHMDHATVTLAA